MRPPIFKSRLPVNGDAEPTEPAPREYPASEALGLWIVCTVAVTVIMLLLGPWLYRPAIPSPPRCYESTLSDGRVVVSCDRGEP
jgi:hypothetical protein